MERLQEVRGAYEGGVVRLLEEPDAVQGQEVAVIFQIPSGKQGRALQGGECKDDTKPGMSIEDFRELRKSFADDLMQEWDELNKPSRRATAGYSAALARPGCHSSEPGANGRLTA